MPSETFLLAHLSDVHLAPMPRLPLSALGLKRAATVRQLLIDTGIEASLVEINSHGEGNPLIRTPDSTPEPRNRRVEIAVR